MAKLFVKQAKQYSETRPTYPKQLFDFIASKTPERDLVWDVGTGSGQAASSLATIYKNVIGTDTSVTQLEFAPKLPNVQYKCTSPNISMADLERDIAPKSSVDLITIAQALHWFDLPTFYKQAKWILKKPNGVIAAWCYTTPKVNSKFDPIFQKFYTDSKPYWDSVRGLVDDKYTSIDFPFEPVNGCDDTGPFDFNIEKFMSFEEFLTYIRSWSAYQTAREKGIELLNDDVVEEFKHAWSEEGREQNVVTYPIYLKIGKVGNLDD